MTTCCVLFLAFHYQKMINNANRGDIGQLNPDPNDTSGNTEESLYDELNSRNEVSPLNQPIEN